MIVSDPDIDEIARLAERVRRAVGLDFPSHRGADLRRGLQRAADELGASPARLCASLLAEPPWSDAMLALVRHLTVGETYLYREAETLQVLADRVLPELLARRAGTRRLRLWSAACCTGEEAYMLAILVHRVVPDLERWDVQVLGTDINDSFLARAARGRYGDWSFRAAPRWLRSQYFTRSADGLATVIEPVRRMVSFRRLNLVDSQAPQWPEDGSIDLVLCRNVLMYFGADAMDQATQRIVRTLAVDGRLGVGQCEAQAVSARTLQPIAFDGAMLFGRPDLDVEASPPSAAALPQPPPADGVVVPAPRRSAASIAVRGIATARTLADGGRAHEAIAVCDALIEIEPTHVGAYVLKALVLTEAGRTAAAREALRRALYVDDGLVMAHFGLGTLAAADGDPAAASTHFGRAGRLLAALAPDAVVPESGGLTAEQLVTTLGAWMAGRERA